MGKTTDLRPGVTMTRIDPRSLFELNLRREELRLPRLHRCSQCGMVGEWSDSWSWYGSYLDADNDRVAKFCGPACVGKEPAEKVLRRVRATP